MPQTQIICVKYKIQIFLLRCDRHMMLGIPKKVDIQSTQKSPILISIRIIQST